MKKYANRPLNTSRSAGEVSALHFLNFENITPDFDKNINLMPAKLGVGDQTISVKVHILNRLISVSPSTMPIKLQRELTMIMSTLVIVIWADRK